MKLLKLFLASGLLAVNINVKAENPGQPIDIVVHRSPTCLCCGKWVEHLRHNNFKVKDSVTNEVQTLKDQNGVTQELASCHTALVNGYVIEGHVPAADIKTLLKTRPNIVGLAVPGMVNGSPGMEMGNKVDAYKVVSFDSDHKVKTFNRYEGAQ